MKKSNNNIFKLWQRGICVKKVIKVCKKCYSIVKLFTYLRTDKVFNEALQHNDYELTVVP